MLTFYAYITSAHLHINMTSYLSNPFTLDLGNLDLSRKRYSELQNFGLTSVDQLLERLAFESYCFSPMN